MYTNVEAAWCSFISSMEPGPRFNIKMSSYQYRKSHCGDKTVVRSSYLQNGISYTGKTTSLYWIRALSVTTSRCHEWSGFASTHWCRGKMAAILQTTFPISFTWMKIFVFWFKFHHFASFQDRIDSSDSENGLATTRWKAIIWTKDGLFTDAYLRHLASTS